MGAHRVRRRLAKAVVGTGMVTASFVCGMSATAAVRPLVRATPARACLNPPITAGQLQQQVETQLSALAQAGSHLTSAGEAVVGGMPLSRFGPDAFVMLAYGDGQPNGAASAGDTTRTTQAHRRSQASATAIEFCNFGQTGNALFEEGAGTLAGNAHDTSISGGTRTVFLGASSCQPYQVPCVTYAAHSPGANWAVDTIVASGASWVSVINRWCSV